MEYLKKYGFVIGISLVLILLVLLKVSSENYFDPDSVELSEPSLDRSAFITESMAVKLSGEWLIVNQVSIDSSSLNIPGKEMHIASGSLLTKRNIRAILKSTEPVIICLPESGSAARIWMILSQMGRKNTYILTKNTETESFKNEFRPDTIIKPEF